MQKKNETNVKKAKMPDLKPARNPKGGTKPVDTSSPQLHGQCGKPIDT